MRLIKYLYPPTLFRILWLNLRFLSGINRKRLILADSDVEFQLGKTAKILLDENARLNFGFFTHIFSQKMKSKLIMQDSSTFHLLGKCMFQSGCVVYVSEGKTLEIGDNTCFTSNIRILAHDDIKIGKNCIFGWESQIMSGDGHPVFEGDKRINPDSPVIIEDNVWVGSRAVILKGVTISQGSIVAANAVVTKDVPPNCIVAGNPAKLVRENISWKE